MPKNREVAWISIKRLRAEAMKAQSVAQVERLFVRRFRLTLIDLVQLFAHPGWKDSAYGGNKWRAIAEAVLALGAVIDQEDRLEIGRSSDSLIAMRHNTGRLKDKLQDMQRVMSQT